MFVLGKPFQDSLMIADMVRAYPSGAPVRVQPYPQSLDKAGKACQGQPP